MISTAALSAIVRQLEALGQTPHDDQAHAAEAAEMLQALLDQVGAAEIAVAEAERLLAEAELATERTLQHLAIMRARHQPRVH